MPEQKELQLLSIHLAVQALMLSYRRRPVSSLIQYDLNPFLTRMDTGLRRYDNICAVLQFVCQHDNIYSNIYNYDNIEIFKERNPWQSHHQA